MNTPNIIFVMTDQQRADLRKSRGYALDTMPYLDSLASRGVDFERAYTPSPTCLPARISMFTGRYAASHMARTNHNAADVRYTEDLLEVLKRSGYRTALRGKNHTHHREDEFDFCESNGHLGREGNWQVETEAEQQFSDFLDASMHLEAHEPTPGGVESQHPYRNVSSAISFINQAQADETPFFLWLSFAEPHNPYQVPEPYFDMFPPEDLPPIETDAYRDDKGHKFKWLRGVWEAVLGTDVESRILRARSNYHGMLRLIDDQLRRLVANLESRGLMDNTHLVFMSDHGDFVGEYGLIRKGPDLPEVLTNIPLIWLGPGVEPRGADRMHCVNLVDLFPTVCDLLGADIPLGVQGKSIVPLLENKDIPEREFESAYSELGYGGLYWTGDDPLTLSEEGASACDDNGRPLTFDCLNSWTQSGQIRALRKGDWKIQIDMMGNLYLYNLQDDPLEAKNLADQLEFVDAKADMLQTLLAASLRASDPLPVPRHRYHYKRNPRGYWFKE